MFSVICCANHPEILARVLAPSLRAQVPHQFLLRMNTPDDNQPCPVVFNRLAREATAERLLFVHQDMRLLEGALAMLHDKLEALDDAWGPVGITGAAGATPDGWLHDGCCEPQHYKAYHVGVHTLDECFFGCRREILEAAGGFCEVPELSWHGYGAELCQRVARMGYRNYAVQALAWHVGPHQASSLHMSTLRAAQAWIARRTREPVATSGGVLKSIPSGRASQALAMALLERSTPTAPEPAPLRAARTDHRTEWTEQGRHLLGRCPGDEAKR